MTYRADDMMMCGMMDMCMSMMAMMRHTLRVQPETFGYIR